MKTKLYLVIPILMIGFWIFNSAPADASGSYSKTWSSANDWQDWAGIGVDLEYSESGGGLSLASLPSGYKSSGTISYHFATTGLNSWNELNITSENLTAANQISYKISDNPISSSDPGVTDPKQLEPSSDLYLSVSFLGDGLATPTLKSLVLVYDNNQIFPKINIEKKIFKVADTGVAETDPTATFMPFDKMMVQLKIVTVGESDADIEISDKILDQSSGIEGLKSSASAAEKSSCNLQPTDTIINGNSFDDKNVSDNILHISSLKAVQNSTAYLCYSYRVPDDKSNKNKLDSLRAKVEERLPDGSLRFSSSSNYYVLTKGYVLLDSSANGLKLDQNQSYQIDDLLSYSFVNILSSQSGQNDFLVSSINYVYKRGLAGKSRGGNLYSLPVQMTNNFADEKDKVLLAVDSSYLLYNPVFYLFGNIFTGSNTAGSSLDMGSRSTSITNDQFSSSNKNNSDTSLYNYNFDQNSVVYWDKTNPIKNQKMTDNINALLGQKDANGNYQHPSGVCDLSSSSSLQNDLIDLNNRDCLGFNSPAIDYNPKGTAWYYKVKSNETEITIGKTNDQENATKITGNGTLIIDFSDQKSKDAKVTLSKISFDTNAAMGLIIINGGAINFGPLCEQFNGIIFASGS